MHGWCRGVLPFRMGSPTGFKSHERGRATAEKMIATWNDVEDYNKIW